MIPLRKYSEVSGDRSVCEGFAALVRAHVKAELAMSGAPADLGHSNVLIEVLPVAHGAWSVVWRHPNAPDPRGTVLHGSPMAAAEFVLRHIAGPDSPYHRLRFVFEAVRRKAESSGLSVVDESSLFSCDYIRCVETGHALAIVRDGSTGPQQRYLLYLWRPGRTSPDDATAWDAERIATDGFTPAATPIRQLVIRALDNITTPIPADKLRAHLEMSHGRRTTPREMANVVAKERFVFGKSPRAVYVVPALDEAGHPIRGWYTRSDWPLHNRIIPASNIERASRRAAAALAGDDLPVWSSTELDHISAAALNLTALRAHDRLFGVKP